jgi:Tectonin domain/WSC domain
MGNNPSRVVGANSSDDIYSASGERIYSKAPWSQVPGKLKQTSVDKNVFCGVNSNDDIYCMDNNNMQKPNWKQVPGKLKHISVDNGKLFGVNSNDDIYYAPSYKDAKWQHIPGKLKQIDLSDNRVCGVSSNDNIFCKDAQNILGNQNWEAGWQKVPGKLKYITLDGKVMCGANTHDDIYCSDNGNLTNPGWSKKPGKLKNVDVNNGALYGTNSTDDIYYASDYRNPKWQHIPGKLKSVSLYRDNKTLPKVSAECGVDGSVCSYGDGATGVYYGVPGKNLARIDKSQMDSLPNSKYTCLPEGWGPKEGNPVLPVPDPIPGTQKKCYTAFAPATKKWQHKGCWKDTGDRAIPKMLNSTARYTKDLCLAEAEAGGYDVAGLQDGRQCFVGKGSNYQKHGKAGNCDANSLGSSWVNNVFSLEQPKPAASAPKWAHKGCWVDKPERAIPTQIPGTYTKEGCITQAINKGYNVAGLQYNGQCFIGKDSDYRKYGSKPENCSRTFLGGAWQNNVFVDPTIDKPNEGASMKCIGDPIKVYRYESGKRRHYPNPAIASSWDPNWGNTHNHDCDFISEGPPMTMKEKPKPKPEPEPVLEMPDNYQACGQDGDVCDFDFEGDNDVYYGVKEKKIVQIPARNVLSGKFVCGPTGLSNSKGYPGLPITDPIVGTKKTCYLRRSG